MNAERILEDNNAEEDLFSLMPSDEDDSGDNDSNQALENTFDLNNINLRIIQNSQNDNDNEEENSNILPQVYINNLQLLLGNNNQNNNQEENELNNGENTLNYNEENLLYYNPYTDGNSSLNKSQIKTEINSFYEEFIVFPFLVTRTKSKNNLIYFSRPKIDVDILSNLEKDMVNKTLNVFIYYYLFQSELNYNKYFNFVLIGLKEKTISAYFNELDKIVNDFLSIYSVNSLEKIDNIRKDIIKIITEDNNSIIKEKEEIKEQKNNDNNKNKNKKDDNKVDELIKEIPDELKELINKEMKKDENKEIHKEQQNNDKDNINNKEEEIKEKEKES